MESNWTNPHTPELATTDGGSPATDDDAAAAAAPEPPDTEAAILADPRLTQDQREALLNVYRSFRDQS